MRLRIPPLRCFFASLLFVLAGCSDLVPGLNISEGGKGTHQYQIVRAPENNGYEVKDAAPVPAYEVVEVTPDLLVDQARERRGDALDQAPSLLPSNVPVEYKVGPGDVFFVVVWDHPELTAPYTGLTNDLTNQGRLVAADGNVFYPYIGVFHAAGMTANDLRHYIAEHLKGVIQNPQVDVRIVAYRAGRVEVTGEVLRPATLTFDDTPKGVLQAIDSCGGLAPAASRRRAILVRDGVLHEIDLAGLLSGSRLVPNPELKPGDVLHIPDQSGDQVFVLGAVDKQQAVTITQDSISLIQTIAIAGGLDALKGKDSGILVFRPYLSAESQVSANIFTLSLNRPEGVLLASQFKLQPRDVVYVKATAFSQYNAIINDLLPTVTTIFELNQLTK